MAYNQLIKFVYDEEDDASTQLLKWIYSNLDKSSEYLFEMVPLEENKLFVKAAGIRQKLPVLYYGYHGDYVEGFKDIKNYLSEEFGWV